MTIDAVHSSSGVFVDSVAEESAGFKYYSFSLGDLNCLTGGGVSAFSCLPVLDTEASESG